jgi:hypothetical protein
MSSAPALSSRISLAGGLGGLRHHAQAQRRQQLVGRLVLQCTDLLGARQRGVVAAIEDIEDRDLVQQAALGRVVGDLVAIQHRLRVAPHLGGEGREAFGLHDDVFELAVDLVGETRKVGGLLDARFGRLRARRHSQAQCRQQGRPAQESVQGHGRVRTEARHRL